MLIQGAQERWEEDMYVCQLIIFESVLVPPGLVYKEDTDAELALLILFIYG